MFDVFIKRVKVKTLAKVVNLLFVGRKGCFGKLPCLRLVEITEVCENSVNKSVSTCDTVREFEFDDRFELSVYVII